MLGSKKRDYVSEADGIESRISIHQQRIKEIVEEGSDEDKASKIAFREIMDGVHDKAIRKRVKELVAKRNNR